MEGRHKKYAKDNRGPWLLGILRRENKEGGLLGRAGRDVQCILTCHQTQHSEYPICNGASIRIQRKKQGAGEFSSRARYMDLEFHVSIDLHRLSVVTRSAM